MLQQSSKKTKWTHHHLDTDNKPLDVAVLVTDLLKMGFIGQMRIHFNGSHAKVGGGEIVVRQSGSEEPSEKFLTDGPPIG